MTVNYPCFAGGSNGVFTHRRGASNVGSGEFICTGQGGQTGINSDGYGTALNTGYSGDNTDVLKKAWSEIFGANNEIFAESMTYFNNWATDITAGVNSIDAYLAGTIETRAFTCSGIFVKSLSQLGAINTTL